MIHIQHSLNQLELVIRVHVKHTNHEVIPSITYLPAPLHNYVICLINEKNRVPVIIEGKVVRYTCDEYPQEYL